MKVATTPQELADHPHGWGVIKTGVVEGASAGTVSSQLTVTDSVVTGYQSGGILFDGARGTDGSPDNTVRTGIKNQGYVTNTVVQGTPNSLYPQVGIKYTSGVTGFVKNSRVTGNYYQPDPAKSYGILLTDAGTDGPGGLTASGDIITGNGKAVYNANADNSAVRTGEPFAVSGSYFGQADLASLISGADSTGAATVTLSKVLPRAPLTVPTREGQVADLPPTAQVADPGSGTLLHVGTPVSPLVRGTDDFAIQSAELLVNGRKVGMSSIAPYLFNWTPTAADAGHVVMLQARVTDSSGHTRLSAPVFYKVAPIH
jgi:hypothetical protein